MNKKQFYYAILNTLVNVVLFFLLIILMFTELISFSVVTIVTSVFGITPEPGITFSFISFAMDLFPIIAAVSIIGSWIAYYKNSKKYFKLFIIFSWGYILLVAIIYSILLLSL